MRTSLHMLHIIMLAWLRSRITSACERVNVERAAARQRFHSHGPRHLVRCGGFHPTPSCPAHLWHAAAPASSRETRHAPHTLALAFVGMLCAVRHPLTPIDCIFLTRYMQRKSARIMAGRLTLCAKKRRGMIQGESHIHLQLVRHCDTHTSKVLVVCYALDLHRHIVHVPVDPVIFSGRVQAKGRGGSHRPVFASQCSCRTPSSVLHRSTSVHT